MSPHRRVVKRVLKTFLPILFIVVVAVGGVMVWIVRAITRPPRAAYLITPQSGLAIGPILKANDVTWSNHDGTKARGWIIRGAEGAPAVVLLHGYGADRSWLLNLAVKLNETTNFTVLWPDLRGHGENPPVNWTLFGTVEGDDATAAIDYLRTLKTPAGKQQVGLVGIYGVELGAYAGLDAAKRYPEVRALALDSVPASPDDVVRSATNRRVAMNNVVPQTLGRWGVRLYTLGKFQNTPSCELARALRNERVLLLAGETSDAWRASTLALEPCFSGGSVEVKKDLSLTGFNLASATGEQEEAYDRPVIDFFDKALR
jgi:pimeloyl-ACP methyl ester carboxylesterase